VSTTRTAHVNEGPPDHFTGPLAMQQIGEQGGRAVYTLLRPLTFVFQWGQSPWGGLSLHKLTAPAGFITDLASVPRIPLVYWLVGGRANHAAVIHDYCYRLRPLYRSFSHGETERAFYDEVFARVMEVSQPEHGVAPVPAPWRSLMHAGVRLGGTMAARAEEGVKLTADFAGPAQAALLADQQATQEAP